MSTSIHQERSPGKLASGAFVSADSPQEDFYQSAVHTMTEALQGSRLKRVHRLLIPPLCSLLHLRTLDALYQRVKKSPDPFTFANNVLESLKISYQTTPPSPNNLPIDGPLIIVANHPFGGLEALIMCSIFKNIRQDVRFIANPYLPAIPILRDLLIPIDPFNHPDTKHINLRGLRQAKKWVQNGGVLCLFPAERSPIGMCARGRLLIRLGRKQLPGSSSTPRQTFKQAATWYLRARTYGFDYDSLSIKSLITHLRSYFYQPDLCGHVRGKKQPKMKSSQFERLLIECIGNLKTSDVDSFIVDIQDGSKGIPVLLRQYLKLGGKIADFHHDHKFGSYDGLIVVDLLQTQPHILSKFMGQAGASDYLDHHQPFKQATSLSA
ncbi:MAG: hypothetical protein U5L00_12545 [Desulfovermiculus sp.]|nr:hypothetical protein [Desulfovermiculus sp.]